nr:nitrilase-related carbon-nitrogen hydrolase [Pelomonas sp. P7]
MALRDLCWWGGGYGSLSLPLLALPGLGTWLPLVGPALFEALLWAALLALTRPGGNRLRGLAGAAGLALALVCPAPWTWTAPAGEGLSVAIVATPALPPGPVRWTAETRDEALQAIHRTLRLAPAGSLVVTPEGFLPEPPPATAEGVWGDLLQALEPRGQRLLLGTALPHPDAPGSALMNVALMLSPQRDGDIAASVYAKQRLAPVGEELPWPALLEPLADRWLNHARRIGRRAGPAALGEPLVVGGSTVGMLLCHEVAFGDTSAATAESLVHLASDHWSDDPRSARQALALARLRALESGKWLLSVSEGQRPWLIDPAGQARTAREVDTLPARQGLTPYVRWRQLQPAAPLAVLAVLMAGGRRRAAPSSTAFAGVSP